MTDKSETPASFELDLEDTLSDWSQVVEDAMAVVDTPAKATDDAVAKDVIDLVAAKGNEILTEEKPPSEVEIELRMRNERLEAEVQGLRDRLTRTLADFENFRKRSERDKEQIQRFALADVLKDFLGVYDNLERAIAATGTAEDLKQGIDMIVRQFYDVMRRCGIVELEATGQPFDPKIHEAVARVDGQGVEVPTVTAEHQRGYALHDRLLRPSMVSVAMPAPKPPAPPEEPEVEAEESPKSDPAAPEANDDESETAESASGADQPDAQTVTG
jgi:molecular chaperone GrpE